jgi:uncharacterized protein with HEPN domain
MSPPDEVRIRHLVEAAEKAFDVNLDVLWSTVTEDLPSLLDQVPRVDEP